jgi:chorismate mutase
MPSAFGTSYKGNFKFSVYCFYTTNVVSDATKPIVTAFTIPATSASLIVPVSNFTATDNKAVTGFKLTETSTAPLASDAGWTTVAPTSYTFATEGTKTLYAWAKDGAGNVSESVSAQVEILTKIGNTQTFGLASLSKVRRAIPVTFNEAGQIQSISVYHNAGSGNVILGVYSEVAGLPSALLGVTPSTAVRTTAGWQTVTLITPVNVTSGQKIWLAWVFQNVSNIRYERTSAPASVSSSGTWSSGIPSAFGTSYNGNFKFSVYCSYTTNVVSDVTKPIVTAFTIPATSASLIVPVSNFTATDNKAVTGFKLTETSAAPLAGDAGWTTVAPTSYTFATKGTKILYAWAKDKAGNVSESVSAQVEIPTKIGNTETFGLASLSTVRRAMPVTFNEAGQIQSISVYHNAGSGNVILGVYSDAGVKPSALLGVTPSTAVKTTAGWQTVTLTAPVGVTSGQKVWLAWVFQNVSNIRYERTSTPASVSSSGTWSSGMPSAFGKSYNGNFKFSVYCTYTTDAVPDATKPIVTAFTIPATSASLIVPVSNFTATDNKTVTGFKLTETSAAPLVGDAGWTTVAPTSYTFATVGTKTLYAWAKDAAGNVSESASAQVVIPTKIGNTQTFSLASLSTVRRAIPVTFNEAGQIQSISVYHNAGSGNVILGVYSDVAGLPSALLGVTPSTAVRTTTGWQTVTLITPVNVTSGQKIWLAWVFQNVSNIRYERTSAPASVSSSGTWSSGMPSAFGKSYNGNFKFSVYCTYIVDNTKSVIIAGEIEPVFEKADLKVYPNPFSDKLYFEFFTTDDTYAVLEIYNLLGQSIERLLDQKVEGGVMNRIEYTPKQIISGFYIYKFTLDGKSSFGKVIYKK